MTQAPARHLNEFKPDARFAWCVTGSGHMIEESIALALELPRVDLFLSASGVPVGMLYHGVYHTVVIAPATSNTVAKCAFGISDTLPTNMFAQAGKQCIPGIVFACDTEPTVITQSPNEWVELRPRAIELDNVERLSRFEYTTLVRSLDELKAALGERLSTLDLV
jgi:flavoprotein